MPTSNPPEDARVGACRSCAAPIIWAANERTGKMAPIDMAPVADGNLVLLRGFHPPHRITYRTATAAERADPALVRHVSHYVTCPQADDWAKRKVVPKVSTDLSTPSQAGRAARRG